MLALHSLVQHRALAEAAKQLLPTACLRAFRRFVRASHVAQDVDDFWVGCWCGRAGGRRLEPSGQVGGLVSRMGSAPEDVGRVGARAGEAGNEWTGRGQAERPKWNMETLKTT